MKTLESEEVYFAQYAAEQYRQLLTEHLQANVHHRHHQPRIRRMAERPSSTPLRPSLVS
jgi:hypothetical protein